MKPIAKRKWKTVLVVEQILQVMETYQRERKILWKDKNVNPLEINSKIKMYANNKVTK